MLSITVVKCIMSFLSRLIRYFLKFSVRFFYGDSLTKASTIKHFEMNLEYSAFKFFHLT